MGDQIPQAPHYVDLFSCPDNDIDGDQYFNISTISNNGIFLQWDRRSSPTVVVASYNILQAQTIDGMYFMIATVPYPASTFIDRSGTPAYYYKIQEIAVDGSIIGTGEPFRGEECLVKASLYYQIMDLMHIPVYEEEVIFNRDRTVGTLAFNNWAYWPRPEVRISGSSDNGDVSSMIILSEDISTYTTFGNSPNYADGLRYKLDYKGRILFIKDDGTPQSIDSADSVFVSYNVQLFTSTQINNAMYMVLQAINSQAGTSKYPTVAATPFYYDECIISGGTYYLLRGLLVGLNNREKRLLLMDPENGAFDTIGSLRETTKMFKDDYDARLKALPTAKYPTIRTVSTPSMPMPGGRSRMFRWIWKNGAS